MSKKLGIGLRTKSMTGHSNRKKSHRRPVTMIAGLGNLLLRDDGVGVHAVRELLKDPPSGVQLCEVGTAMFDVLHRLERVDRIVAIDAMQAGGAAGTLYLAGAHEVEESKVMASLHELALFGALRLINRRPEVILLGVEPATIDYGLELSATLQAALPQIVQEAKRLASKWGL
jgi:hydrogenase maturation protease